MLLPSPTVVSLRSMPRVHVLLDYEVCLLAGVCGNKARKLLALASALDAPEALPDHAQLVSHGGPQSNAMLALARLAAAHGGQLTYHTTPLPRWLRESPNGNLAAALACGMRLCEHPSRQAYHDACTKAAAAAKQAATSSGRSSWIDRGGSTSDAEPGLAALALDIERWMVGRADEALPTAHAPSTGLQLAYLPILQCTVLLSESHTASCGLLDHRALMNAIPLADAYQFTDASDIASADPDVFVVVPAGTGTTALFLARHVPLSSRVLAVPCVGAGAYLQQQMLDLDQASRRKFEISDSQNRCVSVHRFPQIIPPPRRFQVQFGSVSHELLHSWRHARSHGVLLDLVYGPVAWAALRAHRWRNRRSWRRARDSRIVALTDSRIKAQPLPSWLYIHTGGHDGLPSQLRRYARAGLLQDGEEEEALERVKQILKS